MFPPTVRQMAPARKTDFMCYSEKRGDVVNLSTVCMSVNEHIFRSVLQNSPLKSAETRLQGL